MKSNRLTISLLLLLFIIYPPSLSQSRNQTNGSPAPVATLEKPAMSDKKIDSLVERLNEAGEKLNRNTKVLIKKLDTLKQIKDE